jgi:hypothetical protein
VTIAPSARGFGTSLNKQVGPQVNKAGSVAGAGFGKSMLKGFLAIGVLTKITQFVGDAFNEAREAQRVGALVDNAIKQTGGVAKVTAAQVDRLSDAFSRKTGIDDEQIATSAALLLTFKNVRDAGVGLENIFNRATRASADLSASGFGSMDSAAKMLGKALNDPLKGLTALSRAGVTFTQGQQDQIKAMVEAGNLLGAQKVLLAEVESQVGGSAAATATDADKASVALGNLKEQIGIALLPALNALSALFVSKIAPAISSFITNLQSGQGAAGGLGRFISGLVDAMRIWYTYVFTKVLPALQEGLTPALQKGREAFRAIRDAVRDNKPQLTQLFNAFKKIVDFWLTKLLPTSLKLASYAIPVLAAAIRVIINVAAFWVSAFNKVKGVIDTVRGVVNSAIAKFKAFKTDVTTAVKGAKAAITTHINAALGPIRTLISLLQTAINKFNELRGKSTGGVKGGGGTGADLKREGTTVGRSLGDGLARGIELSTVKVGKATQKMLDNLKAKLDTLKSDFASLASSVAGAFTGNLFESETAGGFISNLLDTKGQLQGLKDAFAKLIGWGLKPEFLSQLFQSGNGGLILDLAAGGKDQAAQANALFGDVTSLSNSLGASVADAKFGDRIDGVRQEIRELRKDLKDHPERMGREISGAARRGHRRGLSYA